MKTVNVFQARTTKNPHGIDARKIHENEFVQAVHITLQPGEKLIKHKTPVDVFFYVLEGSGTVLIGEEVAVVSKDMLIDSPADISHGWINNSDSVLRFLVVKTPMPNAIQNREAVNDILTKK